MKKLALLIVISFLGGGKYTVFFVARSLPSLNKRRKCMLA